MEAWLPAEVHHKDAESALAAESPPSVWTLSRSLELPAYSHDHSDARSYKQEQDRVTINIWPCTLRLLSSWLNEQITNLQHQARD